MQELNGLKDLQGKVSQMEREMKKVLSQNISKLNDIVRQAGVVKEKRAKLLKKSCSMQLMSDGSVRVNFDNPKDAEKLFE